VPEQLEGNLFDILAGEIRPRPGEPHLRKADLRRLLRGRTRARDLERLGGHLAGCAACRASLDALWRAEASSRWRRVLGFVLLGRERFRALPGTGRVVMRHVGVAAVVVSVVVVSIAVGHRTETTSLTGSSNSQARGTATLLAPRRTTLSEGLDPPGLVRSLHTFDEYPPSRAAAYTIGLLRQYGVPLSSAAIAFDAATIYIAESGDTWETVAVKTLGDGGLWPMVVLLNLELTTDGEFVPPGTYLRVPKTIPLEGAE
jgi:hypothetical protein